MDLNEKIAQRRLQIEQEAAAEKALQMELNSAKKEFVKSEAIKQLADEGLYEMMAENIKKDIEREKAKIINQLIFSRWTTQNKLTAGVLFFASLVGFLVWWGLGVALMLYLIKYSIDKYDKYKNEILSEKDKSIDCVEVE